jgi:hypothetical protein
MPRRRIRRTRDNYDARPKETTTAQRLIARSSQAVELYKKNATQANRERVKSDLYNMSKNVEQEMTTAPTAVVRQTENAFTTFLKGAWSVVKVVAPIAAQVLKLLI